ncbi:hypothetical protein MZA95_00650 [Haemophilus influenzae]
MTEEITEIATQEQIENELEEQREDIKTKLGLDDEAFDILIKETILASYAELSIRIKPDDPIFCCHFITKKSDELLHKNYCRSSQGNATRNRKYRRSESRRI